MTAGGDPLRAEAVRAETGQRQITPPTLTDALREAAAEWESRLADRVARSLPVWQGNAALKRAHLQDVWWSADTRQDGAQQLELSDHSTTVHGVI